MYLHRPEVCSAHDGWERRRKYPSAMVQIKITFPIWVIIRPVRREIDVSRVTEVQPPFIIPMIVITMVFRVMLDVLVIVSKGLVMRLHVYIVVLNRVVVSVASFLCVSIDRCA